MTGRIIVEYGVDEDGRELADFSSATYSNLTLQQTEAIQMVLDELIRPNWEQRSHVPS